MTHVTPGVSMPLGKQRELVDLVAHDDRVAGVRPALVANDEIVLARESVDDFALGFVAPLQTDNASAGHGWDITPEAAMANSSAPMRSDTIHCIRGVADRAKPPLMRGVDTIAASSRRWSAEGSGWIPRLISE